MITEIELKDFKSYKSATLHLGRLTVLIGANASGKSNVIEALRILSRIATGERLVLLRNPQKKGDNFFRGNVEHLGYRGKQNFQLACLTNHPDWERFEIQLVLSSSNHLQVTQERITSSTSKVPLYEITSEPQGAGSDIFVSYNNFARGGKKTSRVCSSHMAVFTQILSEIRFRPENTKSREIIPKVCDKYVRWLSGIVFLEPEPSLMREYGYKTDFILREKGQKLSGVIYNLCQSKTSKQAVLDFVCSLPEQNIEDISFLETPRGEVMLQLTETFGGLATPYDAARLSDGTLRVLSIAAVLLSAPQESLVVIEEIDNGVHPSRASALLSRMAEIARKRNLRILISSHNPALLDALPDEAIPETEFCYRSPDDGSSQLIRLQDIPDYPELIAQGSVGHLMTRGLLERFVKQHPGSEIKKQQALDWLTSLNSMVGAQ
ncbi:ATPase [Planktothricoides sp. SR001]|uniref:AAA family ATPase n=1 Tax=Planktothricoides sp. SR001 TaxID=1705388 RepID=UPI0006C307F9|nr:ATP-binding protein [Planktothricoides sp. SR001]KOR36088.1 ATPase [Planktothricoides sp. SR001]